MGRKSNIQKQEELNLKIQQQLDSARKNYQRDIDEESISLGYLYSKISKNIEQLKKFTSSIYNSKLMIESCNNLEEYIKENSPKDYGEFVNYRYSEEEKTKELFKNSKDIELEIENILVNDKVVLGYLSERLNPLLVLQIKEALEGV